MTTGTAPCIQIKKLKRHETTVGTQAVILQALGATLPIPKCHRMSVMCVTVSNQVQLLFPKNMPV